MNPQILQLQTMTNEEINTRIAQLLGWIYTKTVNDIPYGRHPIYTSDVGWSIPLPDFCNDLNAMHEAEKLLRAEDGDDIEYRDALIRAMSNPYGCHPEAWIWHATARQRAEAFLRTLNKWKDEYETIQNS